MKRTCVFFDMQGICTFALEIVFLNTKNSTNVHMVKILCLHLHSNTPRVPFGFSDGPNYFSYVWFTTLGHLECIKIYLDDFTIAAKCEEELFEHIKIVFKILEEHKSGKMLIFRYQNQDLGPRNRCKRYINGS